MAHKKVTLLAGIALIPIAGAVALFFFDPAKHAFFPKCTFHVATGYSCPGCDSLHPLLPRALGLPANPA